MRFLADLLARGTLASLFVLLLASHGTAEVMRPNNLDYLDTETLKYYLSASRQEDYDVAVMFYAQWCNNCHALAPVWDQISRLIHAGTEESNLIMALYDCEADYEHMEMCTEAGVKHYPTLMFVSLSGQKRLQRKKPRHTTQFGGNWQYSDSVYDWVRTMSALSSWHRAGWGKKLRSLITGNPVKPRDKPLPLGAPTSPLPSSSTTTSSSTSSATSTGSAVSDAKVKELESQTKDLQDIALRSSLILDALLFPVSTGSFVVSENGKNYTDAFMHMAGTNGWNSEGDNTDLILRTCIIDITLDYCGRLSTHLTLELVHQLPNLQALTETEIQKHERDLLEQVHEQEPFCKIAEECALQPQGKQDEKCHPDKCPFNDPVVCRYLSACFLEDMQKEYLVALNNANSLKQDSTTSSSTGSSTASGDSPKKGAWGL